MLTGAGWAEADGGETTRAGHYVDDEPYWSVQAHDAREGWFLISDSSAQQLFNQEKVPNHCLFCLLLLVDLLMEFWETEGIGNRTLHNYPPPPCKENRVCFCPEFLIFIIVIIVYDHILLLHSIIYAIVHLFFIQLGLFISRIIERKHKNGQMERVTVCFFNLCTSMFYLLLYCITSYTFDMCKSDITYLFIYLVGGLA